MDKCRPQGTLVYFATARYSIHMSTTKERLVVFLDPNKAKKVRAIAAHKKWDLTVLLEEAIDNFIADHESK